MVEIPEHLLQRSKSARERLTGQTPSTDSPSEAVEPQEAAQSVETNSPSETPTKQIEEIPVVEDAPYVNAAKTRNKIPWWAASALLCLPIWAVIYVGTLERPAVEATGVLQHGAEIYAQRCASCHGANGGGGAGYKLADGEVLVTFPQMEDMVEWITKGSDGFGVGNSYGSPERGRVVAGGMPAFGDVLNAEEIISVVLHERAVFGNSEEAEIYAEELDHMIEAGEIDLDMYFDAESVTTSEIASIIENTH
ncbi:MAG: cytochrome c [Actinomycetota bacterium]|nr:cytochrome c [Acidimicrobiales bacterium]MEC7898852.1 cytochrome c [Actinomycetota bacterium]